MKAVFADTFFYLAVLNPRDPAHERATKLGSEFNGVMVTTRFVLTEVADAFARTAALRQLAVNLIARLTIHPRTLIVSLSDDLFAAGLDLYARRPDKEWSLTDCVSFVVMQRDTITEALTGDRHFEQAGFTPLLK